MEELLLDWLNSLLFVEKKNRLLDWKFGVDYDPDEGLNLFQKPLRWGR